MMEQELRPIAIYLPQFQPIQENDEWWGKGFTEWRNVTKAKPLFKGHYQPHLPADLGYYDLRVPETREEQARLAREYGIHGFCYYHYWINGRRILERTFEEVFESGKPDFPFMLCWANENWTRTWDGADTHVLLEQEYCVEDDRNHIKALIPYFKDQRYIRINDRPVIAIYRSPLIPDVKQTVRIWKEEAKKEGLDLYVCRFESFTEFGEDYLEAGDFDAAIDFQPFGNFLDDFKVAKEEKARLEIGRRTKEKIHRNVLRMISRELHDEFLEIKRRVFDYADYVDFVKTRPYPEYPWFPCVTPSWDNFARKSKNYFMFHNSTPEKYGEWLRDIKARFKPRSPEENLVFINAWNEWAEGNHLEPDLKWGRQYLEQTRDALQG